MTIKPKVRLIKKIDREVPVPAPEAGEIPDPKEWSTAVKSWVKEFKDDQPDGSVAAFDNLFTEPPA